LETDVIDFQSSRPNISRGLAAFTAAMMIASPLRADNNSNDWHRQMRYVTARLAKSAI
jgi:hypothetical protein